MIIRKPYAFLIKYFKIIHIILFLLMVYMLFKVRGVYVFFDTFLKTGTYTYVANIASHYVNVLMLIASIVLVALMLLIFFLMKQKKKPVFYYISATIFYFITFVSLIVFMSVFSNLEYQTYSNQALVIYRDLAMVLYYANFYFLAIAFIRGFGFNIKKFNFEKDLKELDITEADREEIEVGVSFDVSKVSNYIRKSKRNLGYYFKENSFVLIVFAVIISLSVVAYISIDKFVLNKTFHEQDLVSTNNFDYKVNASYITNKDKNGNIIKNKNTYYLIVDFNVLNKNKNNLKIEIKNTRIKIKKDYYYPVTRVSSKFNILGTNYREQVLKPNKDSNYIMIYEIPNADLENERIILEIYNGKKVNNGEATFYYKDVSLKPYVFKESETQEYKIESSVDLSNTYLKKGNFKINSYENFNIIDYTYNKCNNKCSEYKASIVPRSGKTLIKIDYTSDVKVNLFNYLKLEYQVDNKTYNIKNSDIQVVTPDNYPEPVQILEVPDTMANANSVKFIFDLWGYKFSIE